MILHITSRGTTLRKRDGRIEITMESGAVQQIPPREVESVIISAPSAFSSELISLCMENGIGVMLTDWRGIPLWRVEPFEGGSVPLLRRKQLYLENRAEGTEFLKKLLTMKLTNQARFLHRLAINRQNEYRETLCHQSEQILALADKISAVSGQIRQCRHTLMGYEGTAGRVYFSALSALLPDEADFSCRERGPQAGPFNQMLNYGYGILYQDLLALCGRAGLDPYIGVTHTDGYNRPTLVYDLVEPFRTEVDQAVFVLFSRCRVRRNIHFEASGQGLMLSKDGKRLLLESLGKVRERSSKAKMERLVTGLVKGLYDWEPEEAVS